MLLRKKKEAKLQYQDDVGNVLLIVDNVHMLSQSLFHHPFVFLKQSPGHIQF